MLTGVSRSIRWLFSLELAHLQGRHKLQAVAGSVPDCLQALVLQLRLLQ